MIQFVALKNFWVGNDSSEAPKRSKNGSHFRLTWSIIFEKMKKFHFLAKKNGLVCQGLFWLLPIEKPHHIEPKTYPHHGHMKLRSLWIWIWRHLLWLQKSFFWRLQRPMPNKTSGDRGTNHWLWRCFNNFVAPWRSKSISKFDPREKYHHLFWKIFIW